MSIIHDALKKAQEQRKDRPDGVPFGNTPEAKKKPPYIVIGVVALAAAVVVAYLYIPAFHPKKSSPPGQVAGAKPAAPVAAPAKSAVPAAQTLPAAKDAPKTVNAASTPAPRVADAWVRSEPVPRRVKAAPPAEEEELIRRIPARKMGDDSINRQYNEALQLMNSGQLREAQKAFLVILGRKSDHFEALNNMGVISASLGNRKEAVTYFNKVLEYRPNYPKAYNNIGLVMMSDGNSQLAEEYFRKAISMEPESLEPYLNLSALLRAEKKFPEAAKILEKPMGRNVKDPSLYLAYAVVKDNMGHADQAMQYYRQYLSLANPSQARSGVAERLRYLEERGRK